MPRRASPLLPADVVPCPCKAAEGPEPDFLFLLLFCGRLRIKHREPGCEDDFSAFFLPGCLIWMHPPGSASLKPSAEGQQPVPLSFILKLLHFSPDMLNLTNCSVTAEEPGTPRSRSLQVTEGGKKKNHRCLGSASELAAASMWQRQLASGARAVHRGVCRVCCEENAGAISGGLIPYRQAVSGAPG